VEVEGEPGVAGVLEKSMPGTKLDDLEVIADLETYRRSWKIRKPAGQCLLGHPLSSLEQVHTGLVLDTVTAPNHTVGGEEPFAHEVGEVELTATVVGGATEENHGRRREEASRWMYYQLCEFLARQTTLFPPSAKAGKLSAYFAWKAEGLRRERSG
jgi:hypothetical protein